MYILFIKNLAQAKYLYTIKGVFVKSKAVSRTLSANVRNEIVEQEKRPSIRRPKLRFNDSDKNRRTIGTFGWMLLMVPAITFCLGNWQLHRKAWKEQLIAELRKRRNSQPITLHELEGQGVNLNTMEYYPIHLRGHFLHDQEMFLGPRTLLLRGDAATEGGLMSPTGGASQGYLVVTPFQLERKRERILVNRGWVPASYVKGKGRAKLAKGSTTDLIGLLRLTEHRPPFMPQQQSHQQKDNIWMYRNIEQMALQAGGDCAHIFLDATDDHLLLEPQEVMVAGVNTSKNGGEVVPIANQTRITLRNEHLSYVITWFSLSAATAFLWYRHFLIKR